MNNNQHDIIVETTRLAPPVAVTGLSIAGVSLQEWVLVITLIYTVLSLFFLIRDKVYIPWKVRRNVSK